MVGGSNPSKPTKCSDDGTNLIGGVPKCLKGADLKSVRTVTIPSRGLESRRLLQKYGILAQLARASDSYPGGPKFDS